MAHIILDFNSISEDDIKEATAMLQKEITANVNDAMKKGLLGSLERYSSVVAASVSKSLSKSILDVLQKDLAAGFKSFFSSGQFTDGLKESVQSSIKAAFDITQTLKVNIKPVIAPKDIIKGSSLVAVPPVGSSKDKAGFDSGIVKPSSVSEEPKSNAFVPPVGSVGSGAKLFETYRESSSDGKKASELLEKLVSMDVPKAEAAQISGKMTDAPFLDDISKLTSEQVQILREFNQVSRGLNNEFDLMSDAMKDLITSNEDLKEATDKELEQSRQAAQLDSLEKAQPSEDKTKMVDWGDSFRVTIGMWMQNIPRMIIGLLKESIFSYLPRQREALTDAATVVPSSDLSSGFSAYREHMMDVDTSLNSSALLKYYGGENAKQSYLGLKSVTGGLDFSDLTSDKSSAKDEMELLAAKALQAGMNLDDFANKVTEGITALGLNQDQSEKFIIDIADRAKFLDIGFDSLYSNINSANGSLRQWGHSLQESYGIASLFAKELEQGKMAIGDIVEYATALHNAGEGQSLFLLEQMAQGGGKGGEIASAIKERAGNDPMAERNLFRRASEGHRGIAKELGLNMSDSKLKTDLRTLVFKEIEKLVVNIAGDNKYKQNEIRRKLQEDFLGISSQVSEASREKIQRNIEAGGASKRLSKKTEQEVTGSSKEIKGKMEASIGLIDKMGIEARNVVIKTSDVAFGGYERNRAATDYLEESLKALEKGNTDKFNLGVSRYEEKHTGGTSREDLKMLFSTYTSLLEKGKGGLAAKAAPIVYVVAGGDMVDSRLRDLYLKIGSNEATQQDLELFIKIVGERKGNRPTGGAHGQYK